jgi:hypothetical protein
VRHAIKVGPAVLVVCLGLSARVVAGPFDDGAEAAQRGDYGSLALFIGWTTLAGGAIISGNVAPEWVSR